MKSTEYLFSRRKNIPRNVSKTVSAAPGIAIFLDYDGTVTPIRKTPSSAVLAHRTLSILRRLSELPGVSLAIVTGRSLEDILQRVPIAGIGLAANHGFQILLGGRLWVHPEAVSTLRSIRVLHRILCSHIIFYPKAFVENKDITLSVHYRNVPDAQAGIVRSLVENAIRDHNPALIVTRGKRVIEVRPPVRWGKGDAVFKILGEIESKRPVLPVFIGDDRTDEDAFRVLRTKGITVRVGRTNFTEAHYYVKNVGEVLKFLTKICSVLSPEPYRRVAAGIH